jgi:hypothetical protein
MESRNGWEGSLSQTTKRQDARQAFCSALLLFHLFLYLVLSRPVLISIRVDFCFWLTFCCCTRVQNGAKTQHFQEIKDKNIHTRKQHLRKGDVAFPLPTSFAGVEASSSDPDTTLKEPRSSSHREDRANRVDTCDSSTRIRQHERCLLRKQSVSYRLLAKSISNTQGPRHTKGREEAQTVAATSCHTIPQTRLLSRSFR